tara:strand:- start:1828 stop:2187 length:360 start_codon:yes stop_codon:yes gene_type:complete
MNHFLLLFVCALSIELFIRLDFLSILNSILEQTKKVIYFLPNKKISDHWKEKVIPTYAFKLMKLSLQVLLIIICIICFFLGADIFFNDFLMFAFSLVGFIESLLFVLVYVFLRKLIFLK